MRESGDGQDTWASKMKKPGVGRVYKRRYAEAGGTGERKLEREPQKILCLKMPL